MEYSFPDGLVIQRVEIESTEYYLGYPIIVAMLGDVLLLNYGEGSIHAMYNHITKFCRGKQCENVFAFYYEVF
jgi:hypothetical protein